MELRHKPHHKALLITDDHRIREVNLEIDAGFAVDHRSNRAWGLMPEAIIRLRGSQTPYLVLYERASAPYSPVRGKWLGFDEGAVKRLAKQRFAEAFTELPKQAIAAKAAWTFRLCIAGLTLVVAVMSLTVLATSGHLRIPGL